MREVEITPSYPHQVTHSLQDQTRIGLQNSRSFAFFFSGLFCCAVLSIDDKQRVDMEIKLLHMDRGNGTTEILTLFSANVLQPFPLL